VPGEPCVLLPARTVIGSGSAFDGAGRAPDPHAASTAAAMNPPAKSSRTAEV